MKEFKYLDSAPGEGKTELIINDSIDLVKKGEKVVITIPSLETSKEIYNRVKAKNNQITVNEINSNYSQNVHKDVLNHLKNTFYDVGEILILTHKTFLNLHYFPNKHIWNLFFDESFDCSNHFEFSLKEHKNEILDYVDIDLENQFTTVEAKNISELKIRTKNEYQDEWINHLKEFYNQLLGTTNNKFIIYSHNNINKKFIEGDGTKIVFSSIFTPELFSGFKNVVFAAANFKENLLFHTWNKLFEVDWSQYKALEKREQQFNVNFNVLTSLRWSKYLKEKKIDNKEIIDLFYDQLKIEKPFLFLSNKDDKFNHGLMTRVPHYNYGLNQYSDYSAIVYSGSFNKPPAFYNIMEFLGLEKEATQFTNSEHFYQTIYRSIIRQNKGDIDVYIPSLETIVPVLSRFKNYKINMLNENLSEDTIKMMVKKMKVNQTKQFDDFCNYRKNRIYNNVKDKQVKVTFYDKPVKTDNDYYFNQNGRELEFSANNLLKELFDSSNKRKVNDKFDNFLFNCCSFKSKERNENNIDKVYGAILDFDSNKYAITLNDLYKALEIKFNALLFKSYSGGFKRKIVFFFNNGIDKNTSNTLMSVVHNKINKMFPKSGLDNTCRNQIQLQFYPCCSCDGQESQLNIKESLFNVDEFLTNNIGLGKTQLQIKNEKTIEDIKVNLNELLFSESDSEKLYKDRIVPMFDDVSNGSRFNIGQRIVGVCKTIVPEMREKLFADFEILGYSKKHLRDLNKLFDK